MSPPLFVLGVSRSGTTLLRVILDRSPGIAIPDETFFIPPLAHRHSSPVDPEEFLDDIRRLPRLAAWGVPASDFAARLLPGMSVGEALSALFTAYAAKHAKPRWGDKTPMYMRHLGLIERLFPDAQYVHLIRDGRDAALAFLDMPEGVVTRTWAHPRSPAGFACEWRTEVRRARELGRRARPVALLRDPLRRPHRGHRRRRTIDLRVCQPPLRDGDARLRECGRRLGEAASPASAAAADPGSSATGEAR